MARMRVLCYVSVGMALTSFAGCNGNESGNGDSTEEPVAVAVDASSVGAAAEDEPDDVKESDDKSATDKPAVPRMTGLQMLAAIQYPYPTDTPPEEQYLELMKLSLTDMIYESNKKVRQLREQGQDWPGRAITMIGLKRLDNIQFCVNDVIEQGVPGDLLEAGAWRGGATIFMRAILKNKGINDRKVWVADSFEGLPPPDPEKYPADADSDLHEREKLAVSLEEVQANFKRFGLLDDQVQFLKGWFKDTFPTAPIEKLAVLRLDGDMYESTMDTLVPLYPKVSSGGYVIVDDYSLIEANRRGVDDYREQHGITEEIHKIDAYGIYWQKK